jgi:hypothetical protein
VSTPTEVIELLKASCKMQLAADPSLPGLVASAFAGQGYTGIYIDNIPPAVTGGHPSRLELVPAVIITHLDTVFEFAFGDPTQMVVGYTSHLLIWAAAASLHGSGLVNIANRVYAALVQLNTGVGFVQTMQPTMPRSQQPDDSVGNPYFWLGSEWTAQGNL